MGLRLLEPSLPERWGGQGAATVWCSCSVRSRENPSAGKRGFGRQKSRFPVSASEPAGLGVSAKWLLLVCLLVSEPIIKPVKTKKFSLMEQTLPVTVYEME